MREVVEYDRTTALVVVDIQNDFAAPNGSLSVRGGEDVVPVANREIQSATAAGAMVMYSQDWHPEHTPHFAIDGGVWPVHCVAGSWGAELVRGLSVRGDIVRKGTGGEDGYSAFSMRHPETDVVSHTALAEKLASSGIRKVVILGLATDYCVKETALDALRLGFETTVLREGIRAVDLQPGDGDAALAAVEAAGGNVV